MSVFFLANYILLGEKVTGWREEEVKEGGDGEQSETKERTQAEGNRVFEAKHGDYGENYAKIGFQNKGFS